MSPTNDFRITFAMKYWNFQRSHLCFSPQIHGPNQHPLFQYLGGDTTFTWNL